VRFESMGNHEMIYKATYFFGEKPLIVKTWDLDLLLDKMALRNFPFGYNFMDWMQNIRVPAI